MNNKSVKKNYNFQDNNDEKNKKDLRIVKTENLLYSTLLNLLKEKTFEEIKVSDICSKALINRSTFYAHYNDKYELVVEFLNTLKTELSKAIEENAQDINTKEYYMEMLALVMTHIEEKKDIYQGILINNRNSIVMDILLDVITDDVNKRLEQNSNKTGKIPSKVISNFYIGAVTSLCIEWLKNTKEYTKEDIINYLNLLIPNNID